MKIIAEDSKNWSSKTEFKILKNDYKHKWNLLFKLVDLGDMDQPLTAEILSDPYHKITMHILYLYSMESFVYADLNRASRERDRSKIQYYGAFAAALSYILYHANQNRRDNSLQGQFNLYRGLKMNQQEIDSY